MIWRWYAFSFEAMRRSSRSQLIFGRGAAAAAAHGLVALVAVAQDLEAHELVDVVGGQRGLVELHPELLHPDGGNVDHGDVAVSVRNSKGPAL